MVFPITPESEAHAVVDPFEAVSSTITVTQGVGIEDDCRGFRWHDSCWSKTREREVPLYAHTLPIAHRRYIPARWLSAIIRGLLEETNRTLCQPLKRQTAISKSRGGHYLQ